MMGYNGYYAFYTNAWISLQVLSVAVCMTGMVLLLSYFVRHINHK